MQQLSDIAIFSGLSDEELQALGNVAVIKDVAKNRLLISEGDITDTLFVLLSGEVQIFLSDLEGKEFILSQLKEGDYFGELALLDKEKRAASAITLTKCTIMTITSDAMQDILTNHPSIYPVLVKNLVRIIRTNTENVRMLALKDVYSRFRKLLLDNSINILGVNRVSTRMTQKDIANRIGASREMVARILREMSKGGYILSEDKIIYILKALPEKF
jgi:CRP/FNR family cyclic AMP-dependent transcriptional regulator